MSSNSSNQLISLKQRYPSTEPEKPAAPKLPLGKRIGYSIGLPLWVFLGFMLAQALVLAGIAALQALGISFDSVNDAVLNSTGGAIIYALSILLVLGLPWVVKRRPTTKTELGLQRGPNGADFLWAPLGFVIYIVLTSLVTQVAMLLFTFVDYAQEQETGFAQIATQPEYILAFISLVIIAPLAEEILFRGYLFGKLRKYAPLWVSILITSVVFAAVHFQWNVAIDVFALSIILCLLRVWTGSLWPSIMLHMIKNGIAFYFLFVNPSLLSTL